MIDIFTEPTGFSLFSVAGAAKDGTVTSDNKSTESKTDNVFFIEPSPYGLDKAFNLLINL